MQAGRPSDEIKAIDAATKVAKTMVAFDGDPVAALRDILRFHGAVSARDAVAAALCLQHQAIAVCLAEPDARRHTDTRAVARKRLMPGAAD